MKKKLLISALAIACCFGSMQAHDRKAVRINEVMVENNNSIVDEYGQHVGWIELYNTNFSPVNIASLYLSSNPSDTIDSKKKLNTMYAVPLGDEHTLMGKRQTVVFFADDNPTRGTFHTNFSLKPGQTNWIGLFDTDGTLIDQITIPSNLNADESYAREIPNGTDWNVRNGSTDKLYVTPGGENTIRDTNNKIQLFAEKDEHGFGMAAMAMCIVFTSLLVLCLAFMVISKIGAAIARKNKAKAQSVDTEVVDHSDVEHDSGEEIAAICMALYQHLNAHDTESAVLTINKVKRAYSPWSSKIYGLRQLPH